MHIFYFAYIMIWKFPCNTKIYHQQGYNDYNDYKQELQKTGHKHKIFLFSSCPFFISPLLTVLYYRMNVKKPIHCKKQVKDFSVSLTYHSFNFKSITRFAHLIILKHECIMMICLTCHNTFLIYGFRGISCFF